MFSILAQADEALSTGLSVPGVHIEWLAVLAATVAAMLIGSLWYGPFFGKFWIKLVNISKKDAEKAWKTPLIVLAAMAFFQALIIRHFVVYAAYFYPETSQLSIGILAGFWLFVGVALPLVFSSNMFARRPINLSYIEAGNQLVTLIIVATILSVWT